MGIFSSKEPVESNTKPTQPMCDGCEKVVEADQLRPYIGKNYCDDCMKGIIENSKRTRNRLTMTFATPPVLDSNDKDKEEKKESDITLNVNSNNTEQQTE